MIYKQGDKVTALLDNRSKGLTKGKSYEVILGATTAVNVKNDHGKNRGIDLKYLESYTDTGDGDIFVSIVANDTAIAYIDKCRKPIKGEYIVIKNTCLEVKEVIVDLAGNAVVLVREARNRTIERAKLL